MSMDDLSLRFSSNKTLTFRFFKSDLWNSELKKSFGRSKASGLAPFPIGNNWFYFNLQGIFLLMGGSTYGPKGHTFGPEVTAMLSSVNKL